MGSQSDGCVKQEFLTTIVTCEGDLSDPQFKARFSEILSKLEKLLLKGPEENLYVEKVEPWNSVRVTFTIPKEAALRLRQLAQQGDTTLAQLGILSVQLEGDQAISLKLAASGGGEPQEIILQTTTVANEPPCNTLADDVANIDPEQLLATSEDAACFIKTMTEVLCKSGNLATSTHDMDLLDDLSSLVGPTLDLDVLNQVASVASLTTQLPPPSVPPPPYPYQTQQASPGGVSSAKGRLSVDVNTSPNNVALSSPLLVNLLQNDSSPNKQLSPHQQQMQQAQRRAEFADSKLRNRVVNNQLGAPAQFARSGVDAQPFDYARAISRESTSTANNTVFLDSQSSRLPVFSRFANPQNNPYAMAPRSNHPRRPLHMAQQNRPVNRCVVNQQINRHQAIRLNNYLESQATSNNRNINEMVPAKYEENPQMSFATNNAFNVHQPAEFGVAVAIKDNSLNQRDTMTPTLSDNQNLGLRQRLNPSETRDIASNKAFNSIQSHPGLSQKGIQLYQRNLLVSQPNSSYGVQQQRPNSVYSQAPPNVNIQQIALSQALNNVASVSAATTPSYSDNINAFLASPKMAQQANTSEIGNPSMNSQQQRPQLQQQITHHQQQFHQQIQQQRLRDQMQRQHQMNLLNFKRNSFVDNKNGNNKPINNTYAQNAAVFGNPISNPQIASVSQHSAIVTGNASSPSNRISSSLPEASLRDSFQSRTPPTSQQCSSPLPSPKKGTLKTPLNTKQPASLSSQQKPRQSGNVLNKNAKIQKSGESANACSISKVGGGSGDNQYLINPLTGELEPMANENSDNESDSRGDIFDSLAASDSDDIYKFDSPGEIMDDDFDPTPYDPDDVGSNKNKCEEGSVSAHIPAKVSVINCSASGGSQAGEKIKLRLKIEKSDTSPGAYKVDHSFSSSFPSGNDKSKSNPNATADELKVPPLHISLRGRNCSVVRKKKWSDDEKNSQKEKLVKDPDKKVPLSEEEECKKPVVSSESLVTECVESKSHTAESPSYGESIFKSTLEKSCAEKVCSAAQEPKICAESPLTYPSIRTFPSEAEITSILRSVPLDAADKMSLSGVKLKKKEPNKKKPNRVASTSSAEEMADNFARVINDTRNSLQQGKSRLKTNSPSLLRSVMKSSAAREVLLKGASFANRNKNKNSSSAESKNCVSSGQNQQIHRRSSADVPYSGTIGHGKSSNAYQHQNDTYSNAGHSLPGFNTVHDTIQQTINSVVANSKRSYAAKNREHRASHATSVASERANELKMSNYVKRPPVCSENSRNVLTVSCSHVESHASLTHARYTPNVTTNYKHSLMDDLLDTPSKKPRCGAGFDSTRLIVATLEHHREARGEDSPTGETSNNHGEDSGIESMDALSEKSPNQGESPCRKEDPSHSIVRKPNVFCEKPTTCASGDVTMPMSLSSSKVETKMRAASSSSGEDLHPLRVTPALYTYSNPDKNRTESVSPVDNLMNDRSPVETPLPAKPTNNRERAPSKRKRKDAKASEIPSKFIPLVNNKNYANASGGDQFNNQSSHNLSYEGASLLEQLLIDIPSDSSHDHLRRNPSSTAHTRNTRSQMKTSSAISPDAQSNSPLPVNHCSPVGGASCSKASPRTFLKRRRGGSDSSNISNGEETANSKMVNRKCLENILESGDECKKMSPPSVNNEDVLSYANKSPVDTTPIKRKRAGSSKGAVGKVSNRRAKPIIEEDVPLIQIVNPTRNPAPELEERFGTVNMNMRSPSNKNGNSRRVARNTAIAAASTSRTPQQHSLASTDKLNNNDNTVDHNADCAQLVDNQIGYRGDISLMGLDVVSADGEFDDGFGAKSLINSQGRYSPTTSAPLDSINPRNIIAPVPNAQEVINTRRKTRSVAHTYVATVAANGDAQQSKRRRVSKDVK